MGILDRVMMSLYTFSLIFLSVAVFLLSLNVLTVDQVVAVLNTFSGNWHVTALALLFLLVSVRLLLAGVRSNQTRGALVHHTDRGDVKISLFAVENLIEKVARYTHGVREVKVKVEKAEQNLRVIIRAVISPESHVPTVGKEIQQRVYDHIQHTVGVELREIRVQVEQISNDFKPKHRVE